jgi:uncharacterized protein (TIRG00374 family)
MMKRWLFVARIVISVAALAAVIWKTDMGATWGAVRSADPLLVAAIVAFNLVGVVFSTALWRLFISSPRPVFRQLLGSYLRGLFLNNIGLGTIVGDASRAADVGRSGGMSRAAASVAQERAVSIGSLFLLAAIGSVLSFEADSRLAGVVLVLSASGVVALCVAAFASRRLRDSTVMPGILRPAISWCADAMAGLTADRPRTLRAFSLGIAVHATTIAATFIALRAAGAHPALWQVASLTPMVAIAVLLPFSIQGIGVRETTYVYVFGLAGVAAPVALAAAALSFAATLLLSGVGGVLTFTGILHQHGTSREKATPSIAREELAA